MVGNFRTSELRVRSSMENDRQNSVRAYTLPKRFNGHWATTARTAATDISALIWFPTEPSPLFGLRFFCRWRSGFFLFRSGNFSLWLFGCELLGFSPLLLWF